ncbi:MAG: hypothetical protein K8I27_01840 [Planctomycetes bacterium]|nr:hypothetical protein [Planctomycetota bacterium]
MQGWRKKLTVATLLMAAFATYVDAPRLNLAFNLGDTLNAVRVIDPVQHTRMSQLLDALIAQGNGQQLATDLQDGNESLKLLSHNTLLNGVVPPMFQLQEPISFGNDDLKLGDTEYRPLTGLAGVLFKLDLPPPRSESLWQTPRTQCPTGINLTQTARAPPLALR